MENIMGIDVNKLGNAPSVNPWLPRNVEVKLKFNSLSMESESENGIFLFILLPQWQLRVKKPNPENEKKTGSSENLDYYYFDYEDIGTMLQVQQICLNVQTNLRPNQLMYQCDHRPIPQADERFEEVWERASAIIKETALPAPQKLVRKTRRQNQAVGEMNRNLECPNEWRDHLFDDLLTAVRETLQKRFSDTNKEIMISVGCLYPNGEKFLDLKLLLPLATTFRVDTEALKPQVETCKLMLMRMRELENPAVEGMCSLFDFYRFILPHRDSLYCLFALVCIACTLPISTAGCEKEL